MLFIRNPDRKKTQLPFYAILNAKTISGKRTESSHTQHK